MRSDWTGSKKCVFPISIELDPAKAPSHQADAGAAAAAEAARKQLLKYASDIRRYVERSKNRTLLKRLQKDLEAPDQFPPLRLAD